MQEFKKRYSVAGGTGTFIIPITDVELNKITDFNYHLYQDYPNPFNPSTNISFSIPQKSRVELIIYNTLRQKITTLVDEQKEAGNYTIEFDASNLPSSVYFYRISAGEFSQTKKLILLK